MITSKLDQSLAIVTHHIPSSDLACFDRWVKTIYQMVSQATAQMEHDLIAPGNNTQRKTPQ